MSGTHESVVGIYKGIYYHSVGNAACDVFLRDNGVGGRLSLEAPDRNESLFGGELGVIAVYGDVVAVELRGGKCVVKVFERKKDHTVIQSLPPR